MSAPSSYPLNGEYDHRLLAATPALSKAEKQESYNVELLEPQQPPRQPSQGYSPVHRTTDPETQYRQESYTNLKAIPYGAEKLPWYKTRRGIIAIAIIAIVVVGAVVGGVVGGTVGHDHKNAASGAVGSGNQTTSSTEGQQGVTNPSSASSDQDGAKPTQQAPVGGPPNNGNGTDL